MSGEGASIMFRVYKKCSSLLLAMGMLLLLISILEMAWSGPADKKHAGGLVKHSKNQKVKENHTPLPKKDIAIQEKEEEEEEEEAEDYDDRAGDVQPHNDHVKGGLLNLPEMNLCNMIRTMAEPCQRDRLKALEAARTDVREDEEGAPSDDFYEHLIVSKQNNVVLCMAPPVGKISWSDVFRVLDTQEDEVDVDLDDDGGADSDDNLDHDELLKRYDLVTLDTLSLTERERILEEYKKVILTQHPLSTLWLLYSDEEMKAKLPTDWADINSLKGFVEYRLEYTDPDEPVLMTYQTLCRPDIIQYDLLLKTETFTADMQFLRACYMGSDYEDYGDGLPAWRLVGRHPPPT